MNRESDNHPPLFRKWKYWYLLVLVVLMLEIILFYIITKKTG